MGNTQRMITFETTSDSGVAHVCDALAAAFAALAEARPDGVRLRYWRVRATRRFLALIDLADENANPLMDLPATRGLPGVIGANVQGGYPRPEILEQIGSYGFQD